MIEDWMICEIDDCNELIESFDVGKCKKHLEKKFVRRLGGSTGVCSVEGCNNQRKCKGYCTFHYERYRRDIPLDLPSGRWAHLTGVSKCSISWCENPRADRGEQGKLSLCVAHSNLKSKWGVAEPIVKCLACELHYGIKPAPKGRNKWQMCDDCYELRKYAPTHTTLYRHSLSLPDWIKLYLIQAGKCGRCKRSDRKLVIDHDHSCCPTPNRLVDRSIGDAFISCGKCIRGLLCGDCNLLVGKFEKNRESILEYLSSTRAC